MCIGDPCILTHSIGEAAVGKSSVVLRFVRLSISLSDDRALMCHNRFPTNSKPIRSPQLAPLF